MILNGQYGYMVGMRKGETVMVPLEDVAGKLKYVDPNCSLIKEARMVGISFGDNPNQQAEEKKARDDQEEDGKAESSKEKGGKEKKNKGKKDKKKKAKKDKKEE